jgi:ATP synthase protein I
MAQRKPPPARRGDSGSSESGHGDPWLAFGYLVSGVLMYGLIGWALDQWWDTSFLVVVGILVGAGLGMYMTWARFREADADPQDPKST